MNTLCKISILVVFCFTATGIFSSLSAQDTTKQDIDAKVKAYYTRGNLYYEQGQYKEAQDEFNKALELLNNKPELPVKEIAPELPQREQPPVVEEIKQSPHASVIEYMIGNEDVLMVSVWQNQDLEQEVIVRPDGRISFPLIGDIQASGLTIPQLDGVITEKLKEFIRHPEVSISIKKIGGQRVMVLGEVKGPGVYSLTGGRTILEAVSLAGGFTRDAVASSVVVIRGGFVSPKPIRLSLSKALKGDLRNNIVLQSEDIVFVPRKFIADLSYFLGQILDPLSKGAYANQEFLYLQGRNR